MLPISVIILTKNEELFISRCIKSVLWADEVLVLSGNTDRTKEIAVSLGVARGGIFLGTRGLIHAMLHATSEYIRYAKLWEMQNVSSTLHPPAQIYSDPPITTSSLDLVGIDN